MHVPVSGPKNDVRRPRYGSSIQLMACFSSRCNLSKS